MTFDGENIGPEPLLDPNVTVTLENATSPGDVRLTAAAGGKVDLYVGTTLLLSLAVPLNKSHVGLGNVDNTSDLAKPVSTPQQTALDLKLNLAGGTMTGALVLSGAPSIALHAATKAYVDALQARALTAGAGLTGGGDLSIDRTFAVGAGTGITVNADDVALTVPVALVNGGTGATAAPAARTNLGLGNVDNTSDLNKPISTATQTALNAKVTRTGDSMSGALTLPGNPSAALEAAPKQYVDALQTTLQGRTLTAGTGLTGGGDLSANRTFALTVPVAIVNGGTGATTAAAAFDAIKQGATGVSAGVLELATDGEVRSAAGAVALVASHIETASALVGITDAATLAVDWDAGINFVTTIAGNRVVGNPTNGQAGTYRTFYISGNDATPRTITWGTAFKGDIPVITDCSSAKQYLFTMYCVNPGGHFIVTVVRAI